jgi:hypothetical protein
MRFPGILACACFALWPAAGTTQSAASVPDGVTRLVAAIERATQAGDGAALRAMAGPEARVGAVTEFVINLTSPPVSAATVK